MIYDFETLKRSQKTKYILQIVANRRLSNIYHSHNFYEWVILLNGNCKQKINNRIFDMNKNDCVLLCPGDYHSFVWQSDDTEIVSLSVEKKELKTFENLFGLDETPLSFLYTTLNQHQVNTVSDICYATQEYEYKLLLSNLISIYIKSFSSNNDVPISIRYAMDAMNKPENLRGGAECFVELSQYSRSHLSRLMKEHFGVTIHNYILNAKLEYAYNLLILSNDSPEDISEAVGYSSFSHFNKIFVKKYGITPSALRKKCLLWTI